MKKPIKVLIVEASEEDAALLIRELQYGGFDPVYEIVATPKAMADALDRQEWDLAISDYSMPCLSGLDALKLLQEKDPDLSFILRTGQVGEEVAVEAMKAGAHDYILKSNPARLIPAVERQLCDTKARRENRQTEKALRESRERYRLIVETANEGIWQLDEENRTTFVNQRMAEMFGYTVDEIVGQKPSAFIDKKWSKIARANIWQSRQGTGGQFEYKFRCKDGTDLWAIVSASPIFRDDGSYAGTIGMFVDITERKQAEEALRFSEERFKKAFNASPSPMSISTFPDGRYIDVNEDFTQVLGYRREDVIGFTRSELKIWEKPEDLAKATQILNEKKSLRNLETSIRSKSGELRIGLVSADIVDISGGEYILFVFDDITERKMAEAALRESEEQLRQITDNMLDMVCQTDARGIVQYASPSNESVLGYRPEDLLGKPLFNLVHPDDLNRVITAFQSFQTAINASLRGKIEFRFKHADGRYLWADVVGKPLFDDMGMVVGAIFGGRDITERRQAEEALKQSEARLRLIADNMLDIISQTDTRGFFQYISPSVTSVLGYEQEEVLGKSTFDLVHPDDRESVMLAFESGIRTASSGKVECRFQQKDGHYLWLEWVGKVLLNNAGNVTGATFVARDVTERRQAEEELRTAHQQLSQIIEFLPDATFVIDNNRKVIAWNKAIEKMTGVSEEEIVGKGDYAYAVPFYGEPRLILIDLIFMQDSSTTLKYENMEKTGTSFYAEAYVPYAYQGKGAWLWGKASPLVDDEGNIIGAIESIRDITGRKRTEEELERYRDHLEELVDRFKNLSFHDVLTGLYNYSFFEEELQRLDVERQMPLSIIMSDVNGLKLVNDTLGHQKGNELLVRAAAIITRCCRSEDIVCRWAGDEFAILLPLTGRATANEICDRIKTVCKETEREPIPISFSLGAATKEDINQKIDLVINEAEDIMYRDKLLDNRSTRFSTINFFKRALAERSAETLEHGQRIQDIVAKIGNRLGLSKKEKDELGLLAALHYIGQIALPSELLTKPCFLTENEWELIKKHPEIGEGFARLVPDLACVAQTILSHHEYWNGMGCPRGLKGEQIPLPSRILAIADAYDVMINGRPYKKAISREEAVEEIKKCSSAQFDPELVKLFVEIISNGKCWC